MDQINDEIVYMHNCIHYPIIVNKRYDPHHNKHRSVKLNHTHIHIHYWIMVLTGCYFSRNDVYSGGIN